MEFLHDDNPVAAFLNRLMDLILVNLLFVACSIPLVTIGASFTAVYDVCMKLALREEVSAVSAFFHSFIRNLKRATGLFALTVAVGAFLAVDFWCALRWDVAFKFASQVVILSVSYFYIAVVSHAFPALAWFGEPVFRTIRRSFVLAMRNGVYTVFVMVMDLLPILMFFLTPTAFWRFLFLWLTVGFAFLAYLNSLHLVRLFDPQRVRDMEENRRQERKRKGK